MPLKCQLSVCACMALRMKYSSAHRNSSRPPCGAGKGKYGGCTSAPPRRPPALIICQTDRCFSNDVVSRAELTAKRRSEKLPGVDGGSPWGGPDGDPETQLAPPTSPNLQLSSCFGGSHKYEYRQETCASYSVITTLYTSEAIFNSTVHFLSSRLCQCEPALKPINRAAT